MCLHNIALVIFDQSIEYRLSDLIAMQTKIEGMMFKDMQTRSKINLIFLTFFHFIKYRKENKSTLNIHSKPKQLHLAL